jgi:hypothetical protein
VEEVGIMAYITSSEYATLTGRDSSEATTIRIRLASKLLDDRIGNYGIYKSGYKIDTSKSTWYVSPCLLSDDYNYVNVSNTNYKIEVTIGQKEAIQLWIASMITELFNSNNTPNSQDNLRLGRFSVSKSKNSTGSKLPESMGYVDSILISSGIIEKRVGLK